MAPSTFVRLLLAGALIVSIPRVAHADDVADEADLQFQVGAERYDAGDFKGALEHFLASNRLVPNKNVLFNIARTYEQLRRAPDAYRYYLLALEGETSPQAQKRVNDALARISPSVAILKIETTPPGATLYLDRKDLGPRGASPRTLGLAEGRHKILVELPGYEPAESEEVDLRLGQERTVRVALKQILGTAKIEGEAGALVRVDDEAAGPACTVPCSIDIAPGRHVFYVFKEGYQPGEIAAEIPAKQVTPVRARLATQTGSVVVASDVRDALITVDGKAVGFTPTVLATPVGKHTIAITQQGYRPFVREIEVSKREETRIDAQLVVSDEVSAASRATESVEDAPASVSIVSQQELRAMGYPTVAEALRGIRGLYLSDDRSYVTLGFRGFSRPGDYGNRVLVLLDGQPMNDDYIWSSYVGTDGRVDIDDIERIEVVRGPGSVLYGSSAFFGVINLVTRSKQQKTHAEASVSTFEYGLGRARATGVVRLSPEAGFWATVSGLQGGAQREIYYPEYDANPADPNAEKKYDGKVSDGITRGTDRQYAGMITGRFWWRDFTLQWFLNSRQKFIPTGEFGATFDHPRARFVDTRGMVEARYEPKLTQTLQSLSRGHLNLYDFNAFTPYTLAEQGASRDSYRGRWGGLEQRFVYTPDSSLRLTAGGEVIRHFTTRQVGVNDAGAYTLDDAGNASRNDPFTVAAGYVNADLTASKRVKVVAGARFDYYSNLPKFEAWPATNPRLAVILKPYEGGVLKIMGAKAFRTPSVYELHYVSPSQIAPTSLSPEEIYSGEAELTHRFSPTVTATVAGYTNYVKDLIVLNEVATGITQYQNSPSNVFIAGGEAEVRREWREGWMVAANYSYQKAQYVGGGDLRDVANSIQHLASVRGAVPILGRTLSGMTRLTVEGPRPDRNEKATDAPQGTTDPGVVWDLVVHGEIERLNLRYNIGCYNLLDWRYGVIPSGEFRQRQIIQNGRTALAQLSVSF